MESTDAIKPKLKQPKIAELFLGLREDQFNALSPDDRVKVRQFPTLSVLIALVPGACFYLALQDYSVWGALGGACGVVLTLLLINGWLVKIGYTRFHLLFLSLVYLVITYISAYLLFMYVYDDRIEKLYARNATAQVNWQFKQEFEYTMGDIRSALFQITGYEANTMSKQPPVHARLKSLQRNANIILDIQTDSLYANSRAYKKNYQKKIALMAGQMVNFLSSTDGSYYDLENATDKLREGVAQQDSVFAAGDRVYSEKLAHISFLDKYEIFSSFVRSGTVLTPFVLTNLLLLIMLFVPLIVAMSIKIPTANAGTSVGNPEPEPEKVDLPTSLQLVDDKLKDDPDNIAYLDEKLQVLIAMKRSDYTDVLTHLTELRRSAEIKTNLTHAIRITKLETKNIDFFGSVLWSFENSNILLGKNGYGKSHLLTLIIGLLQRNDKICQQFFSNTSPKDSFAKLTITLGEGDAAERKDIVYTKSGFDNLNHSDLGVIPVLSISELRFIDKSKETIEKPQEDFELKKSAYHFLHKLNLGKILDARLYSICLDLSTGAGSSEILLICEQVFARLTNSSFSIEEAVRKDTSYQLLVRTEGTSGLLPIQKASQGTLSILSIVCLIYKYLQLAAEESSDRVGNGLRDVRSRQGIVIIDEIDAHLHPSWQQKLIEVFKDVFPRVQFIIASHSPLVVAGSKENEVNVLRKNDDEGFYIQQLPMPFIGTSIEKLYETIFEIEGKDETYKKYAAMIPLKEKFRQEIEQIEGKREMKDDRAKEYDELKAKQNVSKEQMELFRFLQSKPDRDDDEEAMFTEMCTHFGLSPDSSDWQIESKWALQPYEGKRLKELEKMRKMDPHTRQRLDELYSHMHYIGIVQEQEPVIGNLRNLKPGSENLQNLGLGLENLQNMRPGGVNSQDMKPVDKKKGLKL